jgi:DNA-binding beta-propeller fold protein YncE
VFVLAEPVAPPTPEPQAPAPSPPRRGRLAALIALPAALLVAVLLAFTLGEEDAPLTSSTFLVPGEPTGIAVTGSGVWVAGPGAGSVWVLDALTGQLAQPPVRTGGTPARLAVDDHWAWIADTRSGTVIRAAVNQRTSPVTVHSGPDVADVAVAADAVWIASAADGTVRVRGRSGPWSTLRVGARPLALAADERRVVAVDAGLGTLVTIDADERRVSGAPIMLGGTPVDVALAGANAWVVDSAAGTLQRVDLARRVTAAPVRVCAAPVAVAASGRDVYAACRADRELVRYDAVRSRVAHRARLAQPPTALAVDSQYVWIAAGAHEVIRVDR